MPRRLRSNKGSEPHKFEGFNRAELDAIGVDHPPPIDERLSNDLERAVNGFHTIKQLAIICDPDDEHYVNAIRDMAQLHGKWLDDTLARLRGAPAVGCFDADD